MAWIPLHPMLLNVLVRANKDANGDSKRVSSHHSSRAISNVRSRHSVEVHALSSRLVVLGILDRNIWARDQFISLMRRTDNTSLLQHLYITHLTWIQENHDLSGKFPANYCGCLRLDCVLFVRLRLRLAFTFSGRGSQIWRNNSLSRLPSGTKSLR